MHRIVVFALVALAAPGRAPARPRPDGPVHARARHRVGGQEPLPPVPLRERLPQARRRRSRGRHPGGGTAAGALDRRARLGAHHAQRSVRRCRRQGRGNLRARRREGDVPQSDRPPYRRRGAERAGRRELRLVVRERRGPAAGRHRAVHRGSAPAHPLRPAGHRHRRHHLRGRHDAARHGGNPGARPADRGPRRLGRIRRGQPRPADHAHR